MKHSHVRFVTCLLLPLTFLFPAWAQTAEFSSNDSTYKSRTRGFVLNGVSYPDAALFLPISFVRSEKSRFGVLGNYVNRVRSWRNDYGCQSQCSDAELSLDISLYNNGRHSFSILPGLQSLTSRGSDRATQVGEGGYLGFRYAFQITKSLGFSAGGESIIRLDSTVDLGRNAFFGFSKAFTTIDNTQHLIANIGLGSGMFSLYRDPLIETSFNRDRPSRGANADNFDFGLVGSVAFFPSNMFSIGVEFSGYGLGAGTSIKMLRKHDLFATFYIYDFIELENGPAFEETPNLFGNLTYSF